MTAMPILTQYVQDQLGHEDLVIIAPDAGRVKLVRKFAQKVAAPYALLEKERPAQQVAEIGYVIGDVKDKTAVIVDDIIDTGGTLSAAAQTVLDEGANKVYAVATHGVFSGNAFETLQSSPLAGILVTDTVPLRAGAPDLIRQLTCADILTDSIRRIFSDDSVSEIFAGENQLF
jgi:ribose-phosphate pyrophosphokinase